MCISIMDFGSERDKARFRHLSSLFDNGVARPTLAVPMAAAASCDIASYERAE